MEQMERKIVNMQHEVNSNLLDIWTVTIPAQIIHSFQRSQAWQAERIEVLEGDTAAMVLSDQFCEYIFIQNTHVSNKADEDVYYQCYKKTAVDLTKMGVTFDHVVRTWIYLDDISRSYAAFNEQRDRFYREQGVFEKRVPASTGIGISTENGHKMFCHVLAVRTLSETVRIYPVESPLQCSAMDYKVSFSRALKIETPGYRRLLISGTASINAEGETVYIGSIKKQAEQTANVAEALLESNQMTPQHITRLLSYTKQYDDCPLTDQFVKKWLPDNNEILNVHADICRDELLFELEAEALLLKKASNNHQ